VTGEDNWAISQFINYLDAREVIITVDFFIFQGDVVNVYIANTDEEFSAAQRRDWTRYSPVNGTAEMSRLVQVTDRGSVTQQWGFSRPANRKGFYLALEEINARVFSIITIRILYHIALPRREGLLSCPAVPLASLGNTAVGTCSCAANSGPLTGVSLETTCDYNGDCSGGQWCECYAGYQINGNQCDGEWTLKFRLSGPS